MYVFDFTVVNYSFVIIHYFYDFISFDMILFIAVCVLFKQSGRYKGYFKS